MNRDPPASGSSSTAGGLGKDEAARRLQLDGPNELLASRPRSVLRLAREVASEPMFLLLAACGAIYMLIGDAQETLMLGFVFVVAAHVPIVGLSVIPCCWAGRCC